MNRIQNKRLLFFKRSPPILFSIFYHIVLMSGPLSFIYGVTLVVFVVTFETVIVTTSLVGPHIFSFWNISSFIMKASAKNIVKIQIVL